MKTIIRKITPEDNRAMESIIKQTMTEFGASGPGFSINDAEVMSMAENYMSPGFAYFVLTREQKILGGAGIAPLTSGNTQICELRKMYFLPELRGQGLGQQLMDWCLQEALTQGYRQCYLETLAGMTGAEKLYLKNNFRQIDSPLGNTGHFGCDKFYLKELL